MKLLQLLILGLLCEGDRHPYEVMQIMKQRSMELYIKINYGSLYYNIEQLLKRGDIEVKAVIQEEKRPDKTIYRITEQGRMRFDELLLQQFQDDLELFHPIYPALMFARFGQQEEIRHALHKRIEHMRGRIVFMQALIADHPHIHWSSLQIMKNGLLHSETELQWLESYLEELEEKGL